MENYKKLKKPMFLLLTFPLSNQIKTHVTIWKLAVLGIPFASYFQMDNFTLTKHSTFELKIKLWTSHVPLLIPP